jgi:hypothetical protein
MIRIFIIKSYKNIDDIIFYGKNQIILFELKDWITS